MPELVGDGDPRAELVALRRMQGIAAWAILEEFEGFPTLGQVRWAPTPTLPTFGTGSDAQG